MSFRGLTFLLIVLGSWTIAACNGPQVVGGCCGGFDRISTPMSSR